MALNYDDVDGFLKFESADNWLVLSQKIISLIKAHRSEMRWGFNRSPILEKYAIAYVESGEVLFIPLFSLRLEPGLIISFREFDCVSCIQAMQDHFGARFILEDPIYNWPDDALEKLGLHDDPCLNLVDGEIRRLQT